PLPCPSRTRPRFHSRKSLTARDGIPRPAGPTKPADTVATMPRIRITYVVSGFSRTWAVLAVLAVVPASSLYAQQPVAPDTILFNGKIITVDDRFSIAQAVAIRGERFSAVGTNEEITRLAGPKTRRIDLRGRAVTPGLLG